MVIGVTVARMCADGDGAADQKSLAAEPKLLAELARVRQRLDVVNDALVAVGAAPTDAKEAALLGLDQALASIDWDFVVKLDDLVNSEPELAERFAGPIEQLVIALNRARAEWPPAAGDTSARVAAAGVAQTHVAQALRQAHLLLLPSTLKHALNARPVAGSVALDGLFPGDIGREEAVRLLAQRPEVFPGVVDGVRGVAYRTADTMSQKLLYVSAPLLTFVLGGLIFLLVGHLDEWTPIEIDPLKNSHHLLGVYTLVTFGALVHLVVSVRKKREGSGSDAVIVPGELLDWAHVRAMNVCWLVVPIIVTTFVVRMTDLRIEGTEDWAIAILAGYSSDSIAQLGFDRLNQAVDVFVARTSGATT